MLSRGFTSEPTAVEDGVVDEMSRVLVGHLEYWRSRRASGEPQARSPVLIQIDGTGRSLFLDKLAALLDPDAHGAPGAPAPKNGRWTVIRFDAWQYQRVAPPWWWLIKAIDGQLRARFRRLGRRALRRWRRHDYRWRLSLLAADLVVALPPIVIAALATAAAWKLSGKHEIGDILQWGTTAIAAVTTLIGLGWSATNALRRHLLVASPAGAKAVLQTSDPMSELMDRYAFLIRSSGTPVAVLIDNLDRCRADYVVELLEGIQTLFKDDTRHDALPMVLYLVAADRGWLCDSYLDVYNEFKDAVREPGRPFGQAFLDKVFDLSLRIPTVSAGISLSAEQGHRHASDDDVELIRTAGCELDVRRRLVALEHADVSGNGRPAPPDHELRRRVVGRLADLEHEAPNKACLDTEDQLRELAARADPGPTVVRHLAAAYCVQRTVLLLAGYAIDDDDDAIRRLGLWTILTLRWPLLAEWLQRCPDDVEGIAAGHPPAGAGDELAAVYALPELQRFAALAADTGLDAAAIERFTRPIDVFAVTPSAQLGLWPDHALAPH